MNDTHTLNDDPNIRAANQLADALFRLDYHSAQLRLVHTGPLRDGVFDLARLQLIRGHLADMQPLLMRCRDLVLELTPTVTIEPATAPAEKEE